MSADWEAMWEIFHQARELPADQRDAFLDRACGDDAGLRGELDELLAADRGDSDLLEDRAPIDELAAGGGDVGDPLIGSRIGPYTVREILGEGGMGVVYAATQEAPVRREVALKVLKPGMDSREILARFESERQALALMDHPGIARVFDAGTSDSGRPYFAMERVRGIPIDDYCDRHELSVRQRLALFVGVCKAVHHAHQKAIIHRDLKPSNILVSVQDGEPLAKVIDFGVVKAVDRRLTDRTLHTEIGRFIGTPEYMSPEQAEMSGLDVDTRTDIYSLGVVLYQILVGTLPFDSATLRREGYAGIQRFLREQTAPRPSTRFTELGSDAESVARRRQSDRGSFFRRLRGDLDWIVLKAMEKDRTRRYASASELAADIDRHLDDRPVEAGPPSIGYRFGKFVRRHKLGVAAAAMALLALVVSIAAIGYGWAESRRGRERAEVERQRAEEINAFLLNMLQSAAPAIAQGRDTALLEELLADAAERVPQELAERPAVAAALHHTLGETYRALGLYDEAGEHLTRSVDLYRSVAGPRHPDTLSAETNLGLYLWNVGRYEDSGDLTRATLEAKREVLGPEHIDTWTSMNNLALVLKAQNRLDEVEAIHRELLAVRRQVLGVEHLSTVISMSNLGTLLRDSGRLDEAEELLREAVSVQRRVFGTDDPDTLISIDILGDILARAGRADEARALHLEALAGAERVLGGEHPSTLGILYNLGRLTLRQGELEESEAYLRRAVEGVLATVGPHHRFAVLTRFRLADCLHRQGRLEESRRLYDLAQEMAPEVLPPSHNAHPLIAAKRAALLMDQGELEPAERALRESLPRLRELLGAEHEETRQAAATLAALLRQTGRTEEAGLPAAAVAGS